LPDWIALRSGRVGPFPDGVVYANTTEDVRTILKFVLESGSKLIPYGGGTSVVGHINPQPCARPTLTLDLSRLNRLLAFDEIDQLATFQAGVTGPQLENQMKQHGHMLGHYPQSFEYSTLGGWIATRSSGQQSYHYGRIEELFAGGHLETPAGSLDLSSFPASAAGPDLRQLILGSEGRFGVITEATMRVRPMPQEEAFYAIIFHDWAGGVAAVRAIAQADVPVSMVRLSDAQETETTLALSGRNRTVAWADRGLRGLNYGSERCLLLFGVTGSRRETRRARAQTKTIARQHGGLPIGSMIGNQWQKSRFSTPYLRNTLWERGYALDTLETAVNWSSVLETVKGVKEAIANGLNDMSERVLVFAHLSHVYHDGASIYVTYLFRRATDADETLRRWQVLKRAASRVIVSQGGTISHQHGVGLDHAPYLQAEKGLLGMAWLKAVGQTADPRCSLNPDKLLEDERPISEMVIPGANS
jgi:alkyldihydroxyacetonephosphate synthase